MLATALDCHPDLHWCGEYGKNRARGFVEGKRNFCIIHSMAYTLAVDSNELPEKIIILLRDLRGRLSSFGVKTALDKEKPGYLMLLHYKQPHTRKLFREPIIDPSKQPHMVDNHAVLLELIKSHQDALLLKYEELTKDTDMREIPEQYAKLINDYLCIPEGTSYIPTIYKPKLTRATS